nr:metal ABC transporter permease [Mesocricetibacter intestinalis]
MIQWFMEPLSFPFMRTALLTALIVALICAVLSCYLVLKGWSLMGDAVSHAVLPGIVLAFLLGLPLMLGAFISGLCCALGVGYLKENSRLKEDTVMGVVFAGMFALGLVLFVEVETDQHLMHILFGNLLGVSREELWQTALISALVFTVIILKRRDFLLFCFDAGHARVAGLSPKLLYYGLLVMLALTIITAMQVVGVILVVAMLISPGITAYLLTNRFESMMLIAVLTSLTSALAGTLLSYHLNADIGPSIVLLQAGFFILALFYNKRRKPPRAPALEKERISGAAER